MSTMNEVKSQVAITMAKDPEWETYRVCGNIIQHKHINANYWHNILITKCGIPEALKLVV